MVLALLVFLIMIANLDKSVLDGTSMLTVGWFIVLVTQLNGVLVVLQMELLLALAVLTF